MFWKNKSEPKEHIDVTVAVENPKFKKAMEQFIEKRNEQNSVLFGKEIIEAKFLIPILTDEMKTIDKGNNEHEVQEGSQIKILNCFNENSEPFLPVFTDWEEIRKWTKENVSTLIIPSKELWDFTLKNKSYMGIVINPGTVGWVLNIQNINNLKEDLKQ